MCTAKPYQFSSEMIRPTFSRDFFKKFWKSRFDKKISVRIGYKKDLKTLYSNETYLFFWRIVIFLDFQSHVLLHWQCTRQTNNLLLFVVPHWPKIMIINYLFNSSMILEELISFVCFSEVDFSRNKTYRLGRQNESKVTKHWNKATKV